MEDKFAIIQNDICNLSNDELISKLDNYFENLFLDSNQRVFHNDLIIQIIKFRKDIDVVEIILRHLDNYLKEKKIGIRNSIKKGNFEIDSGLNSLIKSYFDKIKICSSFVSDNEKIMSYGLSQLYHKIITDPSLLTFLTYELSSLEKSNINSIKKLTTVMKKISIVNPDTKSYQWFLFIIASSIKTIMDKNINKTYPISNENYQQIINFKENLSLYQKVETFYSYVGIDIRIITDSITGIIWSSFIKIMNFCSSLELYYLIEYNKNILKTIIATDLNHSFTNQVFVFIILQEEKHKNLINLINFIKCFQTIHELVLPSGNSRDKINAKISEIFSNEDSQNVLLETINKTILTEKINNLYNILYFCSNIKNKDIFIEKYNRMLINRLIHKPNIYIERKYYEVLYNIFGDKLLYKTNKILTDIEYTIEDKGNFSKLSDNIKKENKIFQDSIGYNYNIVTVMNVVTSSYNNWDINYSEGIIPHDFVKKYNNEYILLNMMYIYSEFYKLRYENKRKLNWYPHFGEIVFDFNEIEFKMLPIQFILLEHIYKVTIISKNDLINFQIFSGYNEHFKKSIVSSLLLGGIIILEDDNIKINSNTSNIASNYIASNYIATNYIATNYIATNYIELFFTSSNYVDIWNVNREKELILSREEVLSSWINHFLKKESLEKIQLMSKIKKSMDLFEFTIDFLDIVIIDMINKKYIKYNQEKLEKIIW
jgi:hypothetical protein